MATAAATGAEQARPVIASLDTRRAEFHALADLTGAAELIDLVAFESLEAMTTALPVRVVSHSAGFVAGIDLGWRVDDRLSGEVSARSGEVLVLAVTAASLRRALFERQGTRQIDLAFSTTIAFARGVQASPQRRVTITPLVRAPAPGVAVQCRSIDVNRADPVVGHGLGALVISLPGDLALEDQPQIVVELSGADLPGEALALCPPAIGLGGVKVSRLAPSSDPRLSRWLVAFDDPRAVAGQLLSLDLTVTPAAVLAAIDRQVGASGRTSPQVSLSVAARLTGWAPLAAARSSGEGSRSLWRVNAPDLTAPIDGADSTVAAVTIAGSSLIWDLERELSCACTAPVEASFSLDAVRRSLRLPELELTIARWPLVRAPRLTVETSVSGSSAAEPLSESITLAADAGLTRRSGRLVLSLAMLAPAIAERIEQELGRRAGWSGALAVTLRATDTADGQVTPRLVVTVPLLARPLPRRFPLIIDCGATGVSVWTGAVQEDGLPGPLNRVALPARGDLLPALLAAETATGGLPLPRLPAMEALPAFDGALAAPVAASARRLGAPRMALSTGSLAGQAPGETRRPAELMADALAGLIVRHVLPALPALRRSDEVRTRLVPRIVLTVPADIGAEPPPVWTSVPARLLARLIPFFPGIEAVGDAITLMPQPLAAGRHAVARLADADLAAAREGRHVVSLDIGAVSTQVCIRPATADSEAALAAFAVPVAGDALHEALLALVARWVDLIQAKLGDRFRFLHDEGPLAAFALDRARQRHDDGRLASLDRLSRALAAGQIALGETVVEQGMLTDTAAAGHALSDWAGPSAPPLRVELAVFGGRDPPRGVLLPLGPVDAGEGEVAPSVRWQISPRDGTGRQVLELVAAPDAFGGEGEAAQRLAAIIRFLAVTVPRLAMSAVPPRAQRIGRDIVPSGRGALWPPLLAALRQEAERLGDRVLPPLRPTEMKQAVAAGAAILCAEGHGNSPAALRPAHDMPLAIAVLAVRAAASGETAYVVERLFYLAASVRRAGRAYEAENPQQPSLSGRITLGRRFMLVRALPGLDPAGRVLAEWRMVTGLGGTIGPEPVRPLDGEALADAQAEGLSLFGPCDIEAIAMTDGALHLAIRALDNDWSGQWRISGDVAERLRTDSGREE